MDAVMGVEKLAQGADGAVWLNSNVSEEAQRDMFP
jgi:hypothetical protein